MISFFLPLISVSRGPPLFPVRDGFSFLLSSRYNSTIFPFYRPVLFTSTSPIICTLPSFLFFLFSPGPRVSGTLLTIKFFPSPPIGSFVAKRPPRRPPDSMSAINRTLLAQTTPPLVPTLPPPFAARPVRFFFGQYSV